MKKLLAILLAMMLVFVSVAALAEPDTETPPATEGTTEGGSTEGGSTEGGSTSSTPAATTAATAADPSVDTGYDKDNKPKTGLDATAAQTVTVSKAFNLTGNSAKLPAQTVSFTVGTGTVTNSSTVNDAPDVTIDDVVFDETDAEEDLTKPVTINLPAYTGVGVYTYPVTETDTNIAGESYASNIELKVTVINGEDGLVIAGIALRQDDVKTDTLENDYEAHDLTIGKTVSGNMGDTDKLFPITLTLTAPDNDKVYGTVAVTITGNDATVKDGSSNITTSIAAETAGWTTKTIKLQLKDGNTVKFENLPKGVTYTVVEDSAITHLSDATAEQDNTEAYKVTGEVETATELTADATTVTINNEKSIDIDTGVSLETMPYVLILALVVLAGAAMLFVRRREEY